MATDPTILAVWEMIGLVKQNIEFTLKMTSFYIVWNLSSGSDRTLINRQIRAQQSLDNHAANGCLEPTSTNAAAAQNGGSLLHADVQEIKKGQRFNCIRALIYEAAL